MRISRVDIQEFKGLKDFSIDFLDEASKPLSLVVIIGINGAGKSTLLDFIGTPVIVNDRRKGTIEWVDENQAAREAIMPNEAPGLYNLRKGGLVVNFPAEASTADTAGALEECVLKYVDTLIYDHELSPKEAYCKVKEAIADIFKDSENSISFLGISGERKLKFGNEQGEFFGTEGLSSGERKILAKLLPVYFSQTRGKVVLFDEPEDSLHPAWQRELLPALRRAAKENDCQIILATHSPHIIGAAKGEEIRILRRGADGMVVCEHAEEGPFGWEVDSVLRFLQGLDHQRTPEVSDKLDALMSDVKKGMDIAATPHFKEMADLLGPSDPALIALRAEVLRQRRIHEKN